MAKYRHLKNAPITEALVDLRIKPGLAVSALNEILLAKGEIQSLYPKHEERRVFEGGFEIKDGKEFVQHLPRELGVDAHIFKSADGLQVGQFRKDGFTFNRLKPYTDWESIISAARSLWGIYVRKASPQSVSRIAVRYINHISLRLPVEDLSRYLTEPPRPPEGAPKTISSFFNKIVVHDPEQNISANVIQVLEPGIEGDRLTIILDNDIYQVKEYDADDRQIWDVFTKLRQLKNDIFFASITEETARLFE